MNLRRLLAMAYKETLQIWRDPRSLAIALLMPLMQMALLGYGVSLDIKHVPLCIYDQENSQISRSIVNAFDASRLVLDQQGTAQSGGIRNAMDRGDCIAAVVIPVDFSRTLATTGHAPICRRCSMPPMSIPPTSLWAMPRAWWRRSTPDSQTQWAAAHGVQPSQRRPGRSASPASGSTKHWTAATSSSPVWWR